jgi:hypothetical protein
VTNSKAAAAEAIRIPRNMAVLLLRETAADTRHRADRDLVANLARWSFATLT